MNTNLSCTFRNRSSLVIIHDSLFHSDSGSVLRLMAGFRKTFYSSTAFTLFTYTKELRETLEQSRKEEKHSLADGMKNRNNCARNLGLSDGAICRAGIRGKTKFES